MFTYFNWLYTTWCTIIWSAYGTSIEIIYHCSFMEQVASFLVMLLAWMELHLCQYLRMMSMLLSAVLRILVLLGSVKSTRLIFSSSRADFSTICYCSRCLLVVFVVSCVGGCSLLRRWYCCCFCWRRGDPGGGSFDDEPSSERESVASCYPPPQYSRCSSFHHAPPPYTEVKLCQH